MCRIRLEQWCQHSKTQHDQSGANEVLSRRSEQAPLRMIRSSVPVIACPDPSTSFDKLVLRSNQ